MHFNEVIDLNGEKCYLRLDPPQKRTIFIEHTCSYAKKDTYLTEKKFLVFPKLLYVYFGKTFLIYSYLYNYLHPLCWRMPNIKDDGVCLKGNNGQFNFEEIYSYFWCSKFNLDCIFNDDIQNNLLDGEVVELYADCIFEQYGGRDKVEQKFLEFARKVDK